MGLDLTTTTLRDRLLERKFDEEACIAALRGEQVPFALGHPLHRLCVVRGMRYVTGFGTELHGLLPLFTRALNARSIMDNTIPDLSTEDAIPYCIWHPVTASEQTYRELARRYPRTAYSVGRACAVAGFLDLFRELDLLPDVHIAEEARESGRMAIYEAVMSHPVRYSIMNDYKLSIDEADRTPAHLNGDTAVLWMLDIKQPIQDSMGVIEELDDGSFFDTSGFFDLGYEERMFNITEDQHVDENESDLDATRLLVNRVEVKLLHEPLPVDLPTVQKDLLIVMAAYHGNIDRYSRLRRPKPIDGEIDCCVRGIYHNTMFAVWWSKQPDPGYRIKAAINARFIMNNVLSGAPYEKMETPYLIWWPDTARASTYRRLAVLQPEMLPQILRATIFTGGLKDLFDELLQQVVPDQSHVFEAEKQSDLHYRQAIADRLRPLGAAPQECPHWKLQRPFLHTTFNEVRKYIGASSMGAVHDEGPYNDMDCDASYVELMVCVPDAWQISMEDDDEWRELDYEQWPPEDGRQADRR